MNNPTLIIVCVVVLFISVDLLPLNDITKLSHVLVKRSENNSKILPPGNSSTSCNSTAGDCSNSTLTTKRDNLTHSLNATIIYLNLTEVCHPNGTRLKVLCNGTLLNLTEHCNNASIGNISLYCVNGSVSNNESILVGSNVSMTTSNVTLNSNTANTTSINSTAALNTTYVNTTVAISPSQTTGVSISFTATPSLSSVTASSSSSYVTVMEQASSTSIHPSSSSVIAMSSSVGVANSPTLQPTTTQSTTTQSTTIQSTTPQSTTTQSTTPTKPPTPESTTTKPTTREATTPQTTTPPSTPHVEETTASPSTPHVEETTTPPEITTAKVETEIFMSHKSTDVKTENSNTVTTMQSPYDSAKNIKFLYVNVLIPVGAGVCGALLIAFSVILFKCCRRQKLKKVRYFGKPRGGYTRNNMDHMNLLAHSSDEE